MEPKIGEKVTWRKYIGRIVSIDAGRAGITYPGLAGTQRLPLACLRRTADGWEVIE